MMPWLACLLAYGLGSIPTGFWVSRLLKGIDIRQHGSGNTGATNVFRVLGPVAGLFVLACDILKGVAAVLWVAPFVDRVAGSAGPASAQWPLVIGSAAIVGHMWTPFLKFKGGKGVATGCGVFLALVPQALLISLLVWWFVFISSRIVSLSSLSAAAVLPMLVLIFQYGKSGFVTYVVVSVILSAVIFWRHRDNIRRLSVGMEPRVELKRKPRG